MIAINLLPWRENQLKRQRRNLLLQLALAACLPVLLALFAGEYLHYKTEQNQARLQTYLKANKSVIEQAEQLGQLLQKARANESEVVKINQQIKQRLIIPNMLEALTVRPLGLSVKSLSLNQTGLRLTAADTDLQSSLKLVSHLQNSSDFCRVELNPKRSQNEQKRISFELVAGFCDE